MEKRYEDLIKRLREHGEFLIVSDRMKAPPNVNVRNVFAEDYAQAADAIEELSKKRTGTWHRVKATQRSYSFVCNTCGKMYPHLTKCCPFCGVEYIDEEPSKTELV